MRLLLLIFIATTTAGLPFALTLRLQGYAPYDTPSESMRPTLNVNDYLMIARPKFDENGKIEIARGDVIVFIRTRDNVRFIKRVIGLPNDRVQMVGGQIFLNGRQIAQDKLKVEGQITFLTETISPNKTYNIMNLFENGELDDTEVFVVPDDAFFVLGDNRDNSTDSRIGMEFEGMGMIQSSNIIGVNGYILGRYDDNKPLGLGRITWLETPKQIN